MIHFWSEKQPPCFGWPPFQDVTKPSSKLLTPTWLDSDTWISEIKHPCGKNRRWMPGLASDNVAPWLVSPKTNSFSPA